MVAVPHRAHFRTVRLASQALASQARKGMISLHHDLLSRDLLPDKLELFADP